MADVDLSTVSLASLTAEIKRRMEELEHAKAELGLGNEPSVRPVRGRPRSKTAKTGRNPSMSAAAEERWRGWDAYKKAHPNAKPKEFFKAKRAGKA